MESFVDHRPIIMVGLRSYNQSGVTELLIMRDPDYQVIIIMVGCVLSQLKPSELYILSCKKASALFTAKNVELLGIYPIPKTGPGGKFVSVVAISRIPAVSDFCHRVLLFLCLKLFKCLDYAV